MIQDEKAKSIDKLSAVGGTMGLLTGFSLISAVEIIFFIIKIVASLVQQKLDWKIKMWTFLYSSRVKNIKIFHPGLFLLFLIVESFP